VSRLSVSDADWLADTEVDTECDFGIDEEELAGNESENETEPVAVELLVGLEVGLPETVGDSEIETVADADTEGSMVMDADAGEEFDTEALVDRLLELEPLLDTLDDCDNDGEPLVSADMETVSCADELSEIVDVRDSEPLVLALTDRSSVSD